MTTEPTLSVQATTWPGGSTGVLSAARGSDGTLTELPVPVRYERSLTWTGRSAEPSYNVVHQYALLREQITGRIAPDAEGVPDSLNDARRHRMLEQVRDAARIGRKVPAARA
ncbi:hypothetical protein [Nonomuraea sp. NPDC049028]|uniref:hypothetical protein n=1 Tax=Nonomuraea sp. NPDC049028 TaxID=3364348 RepID=UPI003712F108